MRLARGWHKSPIEKVEEVEHEERLFLHDVGTPEAVRPMCAFATGEVTLRCSCSLTVFCVKGAQDV